jgi:hypothetical protein
MDYLIAKIKRMSNPAHYKVLSGHTTFQFDVDDYSLVEYSPDHNLDEDSLFKISDFTEKAYCPDFIKQDIVSTSFNDIPADKYKKVSYLCAIQEHAICFQKVTPSTYLNRSILRFGDNVTIENSDNKILINPFPDAVFVPSKNALLFRNLGTISSIFKGVDALYKEATHEEVNTFLNESFITLSDDYDASKVSKPNRKRIALAIESFAGLEVEEKTQIMDYIHGYCENISYDEAEKKFSISNDEELKFLLYGIEERFYTTLLGGEKRLANSIQTLG